MNTIGYLVIIVSDVILLVVTKFFCWTDWFRLFYTVHVHNNTNFVHVNLPYSLNTEAATDENVRFLSLRDHPK